jgi:hypothetical protein
MGVPGGHVSEIGNFHSEESNVGVNGDGDLSRPDKYVMASWTTTDFQSRDSRVTITLTVTHCASSIADKLMTFMVFPIDISIVHS